MMLMWLLHVMVVEVVALMRQGFVGGMRGIAVSEHLHTLAHLHNRVHVRAPVSQGIKGGRVGG